MKIIEKSSSIEPIGSIPDLSARKYPTEQLSRILSEYNGRDAGSIHSCVVTGQQLGFMGGPIYTILKAISCILQARELKATPIFWLATEDHDVGEIDHTYILDEQGNLKKYHISLPKDGRFVENLAIDESAISVIETFFDAVGMDPLPIDSDSYAKVMTSFLKYLFRDTELFFIEPYLLRELAGPFFEREISGQMNLFYKNSEGKRKKAETKEELQHLPVSRLSTNVASRPVMQSDVIPTVAYVAGPNEMQYYRALGELHSYHNVPMPQLVPRLQATFIPKEAAHVLEKCGLKPWEDIPTNWEQIYPEMERMDKQQKRTTIEERGFPYDALHRLHNLIAPKERPQERVLNWFGFQGMVEENLVEQLLQYNRISGSLYCYL